MYCSVHVCVSATLVDFLHYEERRRLEPILRGVEKQEYDEWLLFRDTLCVMSVYGNLV